MNVRDANIDPSLTDPMQLITNPGDYYSGRRYITTKEALQAENIVDPSTGDEKPRFKNLDKITSGGTISEEIDKELKEMKLGPCATPTTTSKSLRSGTARRSSASPTAWSPSRTGTTSLASTVW
jgi:hypothetical protein